MLIKREREREREREKERDKETGREGREGERCSTMWSFSVNKRSEIFGHCIHRKKILLSNTTGLCQLMRVSDPKLRVLSKD